MGEDKKIINDYKNLKDKGVKFVKKLKLYEEDLFIPKDFYDEEDDYMTWTTDDDGNKTVYNYDKNQWEYPDDEEFIEISGKKRRVCSKCNKPQMDIKGVENCDFCLQALASCDLIDNACCGHGNNSQAYISFKDGRRWILDYDWSRKE